MKYQYLLSVWIIFFGLSQASAQWTKISVPNQHDSTEYLTSQKSDDEVVLLTKSQKVYLYKSDEGIHYKGDSDIRLEGFLSRRKIAEIFPDGNNLWYQMYQGRFLSRGDYDEVYFFDIDSDKAVKAETLDSLFENVEHITDCYYSEAKDILVFSTRSSGIIIRSNGRFYKRVSYNSSLMDNCLNDLAVDEQGHFWLASQTAGLLEYNLSKDTCRSFNIDNSVLTSNRIRNVKTGGKGAVYFNDYSGDLYTIKNGSPVNLTEHIGAYEYPQLLHFSPDRQGGLWLYFTPDSMFRIAHLDRDSRLTELPPEDYPFEPTHYSVSAMYALRDELLLFTSSGIYSYRYRE